MAKDKKPAKQASETFHNIVKASVSGNPKSDKKNAVDMDKINRTLKHFREEISVVVPDWENYTLLQADGGVTHLLLEFSHDCPKEKAEKIRKIILHNANLLGLPVDEL